MAFVCVAAASIYWLGPALGIFAVVCTSFFTIAIFFLFNHKGLGVALVLGVIITALILPLFSTIPVSAHPASCPNNLHNIAIALQIYHDEYNSFPPITINNVQLAINNVSQKYYTVLLNHLELNNY